MQTENQDLENMTEMDMFNAMVQQLQQSIDPRDFMTPTQREIAYLSLEDLEAEYLEVQARTNNRSRMQRDLIVSRYEFEQQKQENNEESI